MVNETAKKTTKPPKKSLSTNEAEAISEEANSFDDSHASQNSAIVIAKPIVRSARRSAGKRSMSGMVMDVAPTVRAPRIQEADDDDEAEENPKKPESERRSKLKATIIAVIVALLVGIVGGLVVWFIGRDTTEYCVVQFESSGGSKIESERITCGSTIPRPDDPVKEGFEFQDWLYDGMPFGFGVQEVNGDIKLIAKWLMSEGTETVTVTFDSNGGSEVEAYVVAKGKTTTEPVAPTRDGYDFTGWYINGREFDFSKPINEDITIVAAWEKRPEEQKPSSSEKPGSSDKNEEVKASGLKISPATRTVKAGDDFELSVTIEPKNAKYDLTVKSSAESTVSCSTLDARASTKIACQAVAPGKAKIEVRDQLSNRTASIDVTVEKVDVTEVKMSVSELTLSAGQVGFLEATVVPGNATNKNVTWSSDNESVAKVGSEGAVTAVAPGAAIITVTTADGSKTASCKVVVQASSGGGEVAPPEDGETATPV